MSSVRTNFFLAFTIVVVLAVCATVKAEVIYTQDFNSISVNLGDKQYDTGLRIGVGGTLAGWSNTGMCTCHTVELSSGNLAVMLWGNADASNNPSWLNTVTMNDGIAANTLGTTYKVSFDAGPGVYSWNAQTTQAGDQFVIELLNSTNSVVASYTCSPDAWAGSETLKGYSFTYTGDGTGDVRIRLRALPSVNTSSWDFVGTVDNLSVSSVPEPTSMAMLSTAVFGLLAYAWRRSRK